MKTKRALILILSLFLLTLHARAEDHWYTIQLEGGAVWYGTSTLAEAELAKALEGTVYLRIDNVIFYDESGQARDWTEWSKVDEPRIYLNPKRVVTFMPMRGDPRKL